SARSAAQASRVIGVAGPLSTASRNLASSSRLANRFWASRIRERRYSLAEAKPSCAIWASTKALILSGTEMFMVVIREALPITMLSPVAILPRDKTPACALHALQERDEVRSAGAVEHSFERLPARGVSGAW